MRRRGGQREVDGKRVMHPWEDMKRNKAYSGRRTRRLVRELLVSRRTDAEGS